MAHAVFKDTTGKIAEALANLGFKKNSMMTVNDQNMTCLCYAIRQKNSNQCKVLLDATTATQNIDGILPIELAFELDCYEAYYRLIGYTGLDMNRYNDSDFYKTPLYNFIYYNKVECTKALVAAKVDLARTYTKTIKESYLDRAIT